MKFSTKRVKNFCYTFSTLLHYPRAVYFIAVYLEHKHYVILKRHDSIIMCTDLHFHLLHFKIQFCFQPSLYCNSA